MPCVFDIIVCRNVLIYFDPDAKRQTLEKIAAQSADDGVLILGTSESTVGVSDTFMPEGGYYRRNAESERAASAA